MATAVDNLTIRAESLSHVLKGDVLKSVTAALQTAKGNWPAARQTLAAKLTPIQLQKADFAHSLADLTNDNGKLISAISAKTTSLRDLALNYDANQLAAIISPVTGTGVDAESTAASLSTKLFHVETSAVIQRMVSSSQIAIADPDVRTGVTSVLTAKPDFNIRTTSIYQALSDPTALSSVAPAKRAAVAEVLKSLQRVQALSPVPDAVPALMAAGQTSALQISDVPRSTFIRQHTATIGSDAADAVYGAAIDARVRNENALMTMQEAVRGTNSTLMGGQADGIDAGMQMLGDIAKKYAVPLNLETLFGNMDYCACDDCQSVYSAAAYFVELMQYLRNNDLGPDPSGDDPDPGDNPDIHKGFSGTPLAMLYRRRPDIFCLELTCENTNTVLPYIDLANEVMESFVVHLGKYHANKHKPKQATLDVFNVTDETSEELIAQPQHINYEAYCILKSAVYPFSLPYHQAIDAQRILLGYMGTSRFELLDIYRTAIEAGGNPSPSQQQALNALHPEVLDRSVDAEYLGMTQEEYIILTREAFWPKPYFEVTQGQTITDEAYRQKIGVKPTCEYYGYGSDAQMLSRDEIDQTGLTFVKKQLLPRTGIAYTDLVDLLMTQSINPNYPQGLALTIMESLKLSYRFLQNLVDKHSNDPKIRYAKLIEWLELAQDVLPQLQAWLQPDPCHQQDTNCCDETINKKELERWVYCYFERVGKLIVLESGEAPELSIYGDIHQWKGDNGDKKIGNLAADGAITDNDGKTVGQVLADLSIDNLGEKFFDVYGGDLFIQNFGEAMSGMIRNNVLYDLGNDDDREAKARWLPVRDSCDLDKVRLVHLDGSSVTTEEYDRIQRFIRLWHKMGWTIDDIDKALVGYATKPSSADAPASAMAASGPAYIGFDAFTDDCADAPDDGNSGCGCDNGGTLECPDEKAPTFDITPAFIEELAEIKKLLDLTGLPLLKLLAFWADISTAGDSSLYASLFLSHNILGLDSVFAADANGNYLTQAAKITDHIPVLMAALSLKAGDVPTIMALRNLPDALTLSNVSALYRHGLLTKLLRVKATDLPEVFALLGDPFVDATAAVSLLETWGKMEDAGFTFKQLDYVIRDVDDPAKPLAPLQKKVLQLTKTLYDGLTAVDTANPDIPQDHPEFATDDAIRANAGLIFDTSVVEEIVGLLDGKTIYATFAPVGLTLAIPQALSGKLKYATQPSATPPTGGIQVTGLFTPDEVTQAKALAPNNTDWAAAVDRAAKPAQIFFDDVLYGIFQAGTDAAKAILLAGDVIVPPDQLDPNQPDPNTAPAKRLYFLQFFMPFLRERLAHKFVVDTLASASGLASDVTDTLLSTVLTAGNPAVAAITALENIKNVPQATPGSWSGYLIPTAADAYTFSVANTVAPAPIMLAGQEVAFPHQSDGETSPIWSSDPVQLKSGVLYTLSVTGIQLSQLAWKTAISPKAQIPASALLADDSAKGTEEAFVKLWKAAILVGGFNLSDDEITYLHDHAADFDGVDFNALTLTSWRRLQAYSALRDSLPPCNLTLLDLFAWACAPDDPSKLSAQITAATGFDQTSIESLSIPAHFDIATPSAFRNEVNLVTLQKALVVANKTGMDVDHLFGWANPSSQFWPCHKIAEDMRKALRARYDEEDWEQVIQPLNDTLRENQKNALIAYLLVQPDLVDWASARGEVMDADTLFEFFLIDVQMCACMQTSRIKQAISTVQLFIQRCMLGLETPYVSNDALDRDRWQWMQKMVLWQANRKVFLYPENWIKPELRDDKSAFYTELEAELLQKDISSNAVETALKNYLYKVDDVANLTIVGLFVEKDDNGDEKTIHIFGRTRNAPYVYYYRSYDVYAENWYPWAKMQVDIPTYDLEAPDTGAVLGHGSYLAPAVWKGRLIVFFPQFLKKTAANRKTSAKTYNDQAGDTSTNSAPVNYWEIKLCWTEYRNQKWTTKQVTADSFADDPNGANPPDPPLPIPDLSKYQFLPRVLDQYEAQLCVDVYYDSFSTAKKRFSFSGSTLFGSADAVPAIDAADHKSTSFHFVGTEMHSLQASGSGQPALFTGAPYFDVESTSVSVIGEGDASNFNHSFIHELIGAVSSGDLDGLYGYYGGITNQSEKDDAYGADDEVGYHELRRPYALYNWEVGLHAPMACAAKYLAGQQFDQALDMCHYVFDPSASGTDASRFWQFPPFKQIDAVNVLEKLFLSLQPGTPNKAINEWRDNPFQPHVVARSRPSAYMKWAVMQYIQILIAYGDYYFLQNSLESIPLAIQCYVLASHIYGPRGQMIPKRGKTKPETYLSLLNKWDAFGNAMVELELAFPFSSQVSTPAGKSNGTVAVPNIFGFATSLYFCVPPNPDLIALRDTIDDRLFKIRHCEDINGVVRQLPLFDAPIDPGLLVAATAAGLSLSSVLNDLNSPMPNYRFTYLLQKAQELCGELKSLGQAFLSAKEKMDGEALAQLRAAHESSIAKLVLDVRTQQLDEANKALDALTESRKGPVYRLQHALKLIGEDLAKVPADADTDYTEIPDTINPPVSDSGMKLMDLEKQELDKAGDAASEQDAVTTMEQLASLMNMIPNFSGNFEPFGVGASISFGGSNLGAAFQAIARGQQGTVAKRNYESSSAGRKAGFLRQLQDRVQQANVAGYEIKHIDRQILAQQIRINIAQGEIDTQQKHIDNAQEVEDFLRNKYTNQELYSWMQDQLRGLHYQGYTLAYDLAKRAEKAFNFERQAGSNFIQFGYWDASRDGLLSGERLYLGLKQLEAAYQEKRGYDFEVVKEISLRQIDPLALLQLRQTGTCTFSVPEVLFDMDLPGHYMRRIKSVSVTVPCVVGPYSSLNCTLRLLEHSFRTSSLLQDKNDYPQRVDEVDDRFSTINVPIAAIAVSKGQADTGVFDLNFRDERYIPFEGAGAISKWQLQLPSSFRQFDYDTIYDVVLTMRYTSWDGGSKLGGPASDYVQSYIKSVETLSRDEGLFAAFDLRHDFPNEWYKATQTNGGPVIALTDVYERLPMFTKGRKPAKISAQDVYLFAGSDSNLSGATLTQGGNDTPLGLSSAVGDLKCFDAHDLDVAMDNWSIALTGNNLLLDRLWLVIRYALL